jgi:hypothetical protein
MWKPTSPSRRAHLATSLFDVDPEADDGSDALTRECYDRIRRERVEASCLFQARDEAYAYWVSCHGGSTHLADPTKAGLRNDR